MIQITHHTSRRFLWGNYFLSVDSVPGTLYDLTHSSCSGIRNQAINILHFFISSSTGVVILLLLPPAWDLGHYWMAPLYRWVRSAAAAGAAHAAGFSGGRHGCAAHSHAVRSDEVC